MGDVELGELKDVPIRDVWDHEAYDFTPWLAENLHRLAATLGVELELMGTEVMVGPYRADIVCRVPTDGTTVLIENQLEHADLQHLGQVLAYLAGLEAKIVVWIARDFGAAHLSALRWLNEHTPDRFSFFAVKVRAVKIGDSLSAPVFEVTERPNDWDRQVRATNDSLSKLGAFRRDFWAHLVDAPAGCTRAKTWLRRQQRVPPAPTNSMSVVSQYIDERRALECIRSREARASL